MRFPSVQAWRGMVWNVLFQTIMIEGASIGQCRVIAQLGEGGMGIVFEAVHQAIERRVAIKVLPPEYAKNAEFAKRFVNAARAVRGPGVLLRTAKPRRVDVLPAVLCRAHAGREDVAPAA